MGNPNHPSLVPSDFRKQANKAETLQEQNKPVLRTSFCLIIPSTCQTGDTARFCLVLDCLILASHLKSITSFSSCYFSFICCLNLQSFIIKRSLRTCREQFDKLKANQFSFLVSQPAMRSASTTPTVTNITCLLGQ